MRRKFAFFSTVGVLLALAVPASSMALISPPGFSFEIVGTANGPKLTTSLGSCSLTKITGTIPANEGATAFSIPTPVPGSCTTGASITLAGGWSFLATGYFAQVIPNSEEAVTLRYASLPGCKLVGRPYLAGVWSNGFKPDYAGAPWMKSGFHADTNETLTWKDDKTTCALKGQTEKIRFETSAGPFFPASTVVNDLTNVGIPIIVR